MGPAKAKRRYSLIQKVQSLLGLSENPRMLGFIAALDEKRLQAVRKQDGVISAADAQAASAGLTVHSVAGEVPPNWAASVLAAHGYEFEPEPEI